MHSHYASSRFVRWATVIAVAVGLSGYLVLPASALEISGSVARNLWIVLGPIGAFCIQILMQLMTLGEDKALRSSEQERLAIIADERVRYLWDITSVAVLALLVCLLSGSITENYYLRVIVANAFGLAAWTGLLAARLPALYREIRDFRWQLARERNEAEMHRSALADIKDDGKQREPDVPEPKWLD